jgi:hypothetical protein
LDRHVEKAFPEIIGDICLLRATNVVFDEICRDFEEVATLIAQKESDGPQSTDPYLADLLHTLEGLHGEITNRLRHHSERRN